MKKIIPICLGILLLPFLSFAHEGHGHTHGFTIKHYFAEPEHLAVNFVFLAVAIVFFWYQRNKSQKAG